MKQKAAQLSEPSPADEGHLGTNLTSELLRAKKRPQGVFAKDSRGQALKRVDTREPAIVRFLEEFDDREHARPRYRERRMVFLETISNYYREAKAKSKLVLDEMTRNHEFSTPPTKTGSDRYDPRLDPLFEER